MKKFILIFSFIVLGTAAFSQTSSENSSAISSLKVEIKATSNKEKIKELGAELKIREALQEAFNKNDKALITRKKAELKAIEEEKSGSSRKKSNDYNSSRSNQGRKR
jgi:hypothetical protein